MVSDRVVPGGPARMGSPRVARSPHLGLRSVATRPYAGISPVRGNHGCDRTNRWVCVSGDGFGAARDEGRGPDAGRGYATWHRHRRTRGYSPPSIRSDRPAAPSAAPRSPRASWLIRFEPLGPYRNPSRLARMHDSDPVPGGLSPPSTRTRAFPPVAAQLPVRLLAMRGRGGGFGGGGGRDRGPARRCRSASVWCG